MSRGANFLLNESQFPSIQVSSIQLSDGIPQVFTSGIFHNSERNIDQHTLMPTVFNNELFSVHKHLCTSSRLPFSNSLFVGVGICDLSRLAHEVLQVLHQTTERGPQTHTTAHSHFFCHSWLPSRCHTI